MTTNKGEYNKDLIRCLDSYWKVLADTKDMFEYTSDEETTRYIYEPHKDLEKNKNLSGNIIGQSL